jgi:protein ImuB
MNLEAAFGEDARRKSMPSTYEKTFTFPLPLRDPQTILRLLRLQLAAHPPKAPILKITLAADFAAPRNTQKGLFVPGTPDPEKLELTVARLAHLVGEANVGSPTLVDTHRPGEFRMSHFMLLDDEHGKNSVLDSLPKPAAAFRAFRPPMVARVELRAGFPVHVEFHGRRGEVAVASGPWRTSGDWWRKDAWQREECDLELRIPLFPARRGQEDSTGAHAHASPRNSVYRVYFDLLRGGWFIGGIYD